MDLFNFNSPNPAKAGKILISQPFLSDPNFERSIILLCAHDDAGSFGFVLNKPLDATFSEIIDGFETLDLPVYNGGPVQQDVINYIHRFPDLMGAVSIAEGIYMGGDLDHLRELHSLGGCTKDQIRFFLGYSGWSEGQLEAELEEKAWIVTNRVDESFIFITDPAEMWRKAMAGLGGRFVHYSNYPSDPRLN